MTIRKITTTETKTKMKQRKCIGKGVNGEQNRIKDDKTVKNDNERGKIRYKRDLIMNCRCLLLFLRETKLVERDEQPQTTKTL